MYVRRHIEMVYTYKDVWEVGDKSTLTLFPVVPCVRARGLDP